MSILQMSIQAGVLIVAIVLVRAIALNKLPKTTFLVLWAVTLARLLVPFSISSQLSIYTLVGNALDLAPTSTTPTPGVTPLQNNPLIGGVVAVDIPAQTIGQQAIPIDPLLLAWIIGMAAALLFFAVIFWRNCRELRFAWIVRNNEFIDEWLNSHKLLRSISVLQSDRITTPITMGYLRPRIILPKAMDMKGEQLLRYVLTHEYYHIRRFDAIWKLLVTFALCVHWFNPLVWVMVILVNRDLEITCDEMVVRHFGADMKVPYAHSLIDMAEQRSKLTPLFSGFSKNAAEERITAIMKYKKTSVVAIVLAAVLVIGITTVFAANKDTGSFSKGDTIIAQISADSVSDLWAYEFALHYNDSAMKIKSIHSTVDGISVFTKREDGSVKVGATREGSDGFNGKNTPICEIVMEVLRDGPVEGLSIRDVCVLDSAINLVEDTSGWDIKVVPLSEERRLFFESQESNLFEDNRNHETDLPEMIYSEEPFFERFREPGYHVGEYSGELRLNVEKQDVSPGESFWVEVSLSEPTESILGEVYFWFDPDELTYQGFEGDEKLHPWHQALDSDAGIVSILFLTFEETDNQIERFGRFCFTVSENAQLSGHQLSVPIVANYSLKEGKVGDEKNTLSQSAEISISVK